MITDRMVTDIVDAELVVADLTELNPNVFYELGIRHSAQGKTIHIAKTGTTLPFDNVAHRTIFVDLTDWHSQEKARSSLAEAVRATRRSDYKVSNPITQANASFQMRESSDPRDQLIAQLSERLAALEHMASSERTISDIRPLSWNFVVTTSAKTNADAQVILRSIAKIMPIKTGRLIEGPDNYKLILATYEPTLVDDVSEVRRRIAEWQRAILKIPGLIALQVDGP
jgi:hypothetical protein